MQRLALIRNQLSNSCEVKSYLITVEPASLNKAIKIVKISSEKSLNALNEKLLEELYRTIIKLDRCPETKVIILTGSGKAFAAGADINKFLKSDYAEMAKNDWDLLHIENIYYHTNKPLIAAINGFAFGGGFELALCCDILIASDKATFGFPELKLALFPGSGGTQRLTKLMGYHKAIEYILTCKNIDLNELKQFGVINHIVPHDNLMKTAIEMADQICKFSLIAVIAAKKATKLSQETSLYSGLKAEKYIFQGIFNSEDKNIGVTSFLNKKQPVFKDK
jgi:enoyl-CoA hydratase/carnithine racemase